MVVINRMRNMAAVTSSPILSLASEGRPGGGGCVICVGVVVWVEVVGLEVEA